MEELRRERRVVMFSDVRGFARAFTADETRVVEFVQRYYEAAGDQIVQHGGTIVKYIGDSVLSLFPAGAEERAVDCAMKTQQSVDSIIKEMGFSPAMGLDAGISSGEVFVGLFGHSSLRREDVFGQVVNEAAKVMQRGVTVTQSVYERLKDRFQWVGVPDIQLKWRDVSLTVWKIATSS